MAVEVVEHAWGHFAFWGHFAAANVSYAKCPWGHFAALQLPIGTLVDVRFYYVKWHVINTNIIWLVRIQSMIPTNRNFSTSVERRLIIFPLLVVIYAWYCSLKTCQINQKHVFFLYFIHGSTAMIVLTTITVSIIIPITVILSWTPSSPLSLPFLYVTMHVH